MGAPIIAKLAGIKEMSTFPFLLSSFLANAVSRATPAIYTKLIWPWLDSLNKILIILERWAIFLVF
jgi:hypothetical protein